MRRSALLLAALIGLSSLAGVAGSTNSAPTAHWTTLKANAAGGFRYAKVISRSAFAGEYVVRACQRTCRVKATASYRIVKVKPV